MINLLKKLLGIRQATDLGKLIAEGALIVDVRTPAEFRDGHVKGSLNIPLQQLSTSIKKLKDKDRVIITCCASGMRSASAKTILKSAGYPQVYNGGSWLRLKQYEK
jgi:phage shock protein E